MQRIGRLWPWAFALLIAAAGGFLFLRSRANNSAAVNAAGYTQTTVVTRGDISAELSVTGQVEAAQQTNLSFDHLQGRTPLLALTVQAGNTVTNGQVLAAVDPAPYQQTRDQAASDLQDATERLADLQAPVTALARAKADLAIARANVELESARTTLDDLLHPDLAELANKVADATRALSEAQSDLAALSEDTAAADRLTRLRDVEAKAAAEHARLAAESYRDAYQQDRLQLAYNTMLNAQDARQTEELQQRANLFKAQMDVRKAQTSLAAAQEALAEAQAGGDALALAKARLALQEAQVALTQAQEDRTDLDAGPDPVELAAAQASVDKKRLALADAETALAACQLRAPFDATILQTNAETGDLVSANTRILTLANLATLQIVAAVDETAIRQVVAGQTAQISFDAFPGRTLRGQVVSVPLQGALQGDVMVYEVPIALADQANLPLLVGMTANVKISLGQASNALLVPTIALQRSGGLVQVLIPDPANPAADPQAVPVETGLSDGINTQIVRGLNEGDRIVIPIAAAQSTNPFQGRGAGGIFVGPAPAGAGRVPQGR